MKTFNNKVAVITGAGGGIGRELARQLASQGCHLALADIGEENLSATADIVKAFSVNVSQHIVDVSDDEKYQQFVSDVLAMHGSVDLLINNAGITLQRSFENHRIEDWKLVLGVNLWGVIHGCKYFLPALKQSNDAHIVNLSSMAGFIGLPNQSSYSSTKAAVRSISESLAAELIGQNIQVTCVHPGAIATNMIRNTLDKADNIENAKKNLAMAEKIAMPVNQAAEKILNAVLKNKLRVRVGKDAILLDLLKRLLPVASVKMIMRAVTKRINNKAKAS